MNRKVRIEVKTNYDLVSFLIEKNIFYNEFYQTLGKSYAEMFIWTLTLLKPIEFNKAFQETYERINNL